MISVSHPENPCKNDCPIFFILNEHYDMIAEDTVFGCVFVCLASGVIGLSS